MKKIESIEDFYQRKFQQTPDGVREETGHFNVFRVDSLDGTGTRPLPYQRRDYYKITLLVGKKSKITYADREFEVARQALVFTNPLIPYKWEHQDPDNRGCYCIFNQAFFHQFGQLSQYALFQPSSNHVFELTDEQVEKVQACYERMFEEINSEYVHKYDVLRNLVYELLHFAMRMQPSVSLEQQANASQRIATLFLELLERQFPIDDQHTSMQLRSASDFARQLNVHVNHLNRAVKEITQKTTTQLIGERVLQEAKILLRHSNWGVAEIGYALGFTEATHFSNFFKKHTETSPMKFRNH